MENGGKISVLGSLFNGTCVNYDSITNKSLVLGGNKIAGTVSFVNQSKGNIEFTGKINNNGKLVFSGAGSGKLYISSEIKGVAYVVNETDGYINMTLSEIPNNAVISKFGLGDGI